MSGGGLDWPGLMRAGMGPRAAGGLGLVPREFWALTPAELALMLGVTQAPTAMTRDRLTELAARFPDQPRARAQAPVDHPQNRADGVTAPEQKEDHNGEQGRIFDAWR